LRNLPLFGEGLLLRWLLSSVVDKRNLSAEAVVECCKAMDLDANCPGVCTALLDWIWSSEGSDVGFSSYTVPSY